MPPLSPLYSGLPTPHILSLSLTVPPPTPPTPPTSTQLHFLVTTHRSVLLDLLVVSDDLPDAVDEAALVVGDQAHEYSLLGGVEEHQHSHLTGRSRVGEVDAAGLGEEGHRAD